MSTLPDLSDIIVRLTGGRAGSPEHIFLWKDARVNGAVAPAAINGRVTSLWQYEGTLGNGSAPGAVAVPTEATSGSLRQTDPVGSRQKWAIGGTAAGGTTAAGGLILYDRLLHISGFSGTNTGAQTVGGSLTRYTNGLGNQMWVEIYTQIGATATTITASYTDQDGNSGVTSTAEAIGGTGVREAQRIIPIRPAAADWGVQAVANVTLLATTGTAGDFGVTIAHPLAYFPCPLSAQATARNMISFAPGPIEILPNACLALAWVGDAVAAPTLFFNLGMVEA